MLRQEVVAALRGRTSTRQHKRPDTEAAHACDAERRLAVATRYVGFGMPSKAVGRLIPPPHQRDSALTPSPRPTQLAKLSCTPLSTWRVEPALSGLRPNFLRQLMERSASSDIAKTMAAFEGVLANDGAPPALAPYIAGAAGHTPKKDAKTGRPPLRSSTTSRKCSTLSTGSFPCSAHIPPGHPMAPVDLPPLSAPPSS